MVSSQQSPPVQVPAAPPAPPPPSLQARLCGYQDARLKEPSPAGFVQARHGAGGSVHVSSPDDDQAPTVQGLGSSTNRPPQGASRLESVIHPIRSSERRDVIMQVDFMGYRPTGPVQVYQYVRAVAFRELLSIVPVNESWVKAHFTPEEMLRCSVTLMGFPYHESSDSLLRRSTRA